MASLSFRFSPIKRALLQKYGIATHWSTTHLGYWSALRYLVREGLPKKPASALDPQPLAWHVDGAQENQRDLSERPTTAPSIEARREKAVAAAEKEGKEEPKPSELDVWPLVVKHNIRNGDDCQDGVDQLIHIAKEACSPAMVKFLFKIRHKLRTLIDDIWQWECVEDRLRLSQRPRGEALMAAMRSPCTCGGAWLHHVQESLAVNGISVSELTHDIYTSLVQGRSESTPVVCLAGLQGGEGKSLIFYPFPAVFGESLVHHHVAAGTFPLLDLEGKKVVVLDEWNFRSATLPMGTQLLWFEGKPVPVTRPQDHFVGHAVYKGSAPIFITTPLTRMEKLMQEAADAVRMGSSCEATMMLRRLKVYRFSQKVSKPTKQIPQCAACFASWVLEGEAEWGQQH